MKLATSIIAGLAFMLSTQLFAEGDGKKGKGDMRAKILEKFDTNNDGQLDETEKEALKKAMAERRASGEGKGDRAGREDMHKKMLEKFDTNKDGKLDETEREALKKAMAERRASGEGKGDRAKKGKRDGVEKEGGVEPVRP